MAFPYPPDRGITGWYQSLGSDILSTTSWQINDVLICSWRARVLNIHSNRKYGVIFSLNPEILLSYSFQLLPNIHSINSYVLYPEIIISLILSIYYIIIVDCNLFHVHLAPYRNFEDEIFVRWVDCNTLFPGYVPRYVS